MLPLFPYSRQSDIPYNKTGAPLAKVPGTRSRTGTYSFESRPQTPHPGQSPPSLLPAHLCDARPPAATLPRDCPSRAQPGTTTTTHASTALCAPGFARRDRT